MKTNHITPRTFRGLSLLLGLAALGLAAPSQGAAIGINFVGGNGGSSVTSTNSAGVVSQSNWNNASGGSGNFAANSVVDSGGSLLADTTVAWSAYSTYGFGETPGATDGNSQMMKGCLDGWGGNTGTVTITNVPYAHFSVYLYYPNGNGSSGTYTANGIATVPASLAGTPWNVNAGDTFKLPDGSGHGGNYYPELRSLIRNMS